MARYIQTRGMDARGLVFSSPFLQVSDDVSRVLIALAGVLGRLTPWLPVASVDSSGASRIPEVVKAYDDDPLVFHGKILARTGAQLNAAISRARANFGAITGPVYIIHGGADRLVPAGGSKLLYERCRSEDKQCKVYEGGYHELLNDVEGEMVMAELCAWLEARL
jgi:alpha-beta hydrolase superfamily lysophospholipase